MDFDTQFHNIEAETGVRMVWNNLPSTKVGAFKAVLPMAVNMHKFSFINLNFSIKNK